MHSRAGSGWPRSLPSPPDVRMALPRCAGRPYYHSADRTSPRSPRRGPSERLRSPAAHRRRPGEGGCPRRMWAPGRPTRYARVTVVILAETGPAPTRWSAAPPGWTWGATASGLGRPPSPPQWPRPPSRPRAPRTRPAGAGPAGWEAPPPVRPRARGAPLRLRGAAVTALRTILGSAWAGETVALGAGVAACQKGRAEGRGEPEQPARRSPATRGGPGLRSPAPRSWPWAPPVPRPWPRWPPGAQGRHRGGHAGGSRPGTVPGPLRPPQR